jgi:phosphatidylglycerol---prolipoprotein diacylglyceryl transferase
MNPVLARVFGEPVPAFFVFIALAYLLAAVVFVGSAAAEGRDADAHVDLALLTVVAGIAGGRLAHVLFDGHLADYIHLCTAPELVDWPLDRVTCTSAEWGGVWDAARGTCHPASADCFAWARFWSGGLTFYGGLFAAGAAGVWSARRDHLGVAATLDRAAMAVPLGLAVGRLGCFFAGCCFGAPTPSALGVVFPPGSDASVAQAKAGLLASRSLWSLPVHPTQLYEAAGALVLAAIIAFVVRPRQRREGESFLVFCIGYAALRFGLEFLRADERGGAAGLSTSQILSIVLVVLALLGSRALRAGETAAASR